MVRRQQVVREFFSEAETLREALDAKFRNPYRDSIRWEYFCDPKMYAYLRTDPRAAFPKETYESFLQQLRSWCRDNLGLMPHGEPSLHLMVNGCKLGLHSDFHNGVWGFVYSLTRWESRRFSGGETLLLRDGVPSYKKHHVQGEVLYELVPASFNQLLVFDDRIVHATPMIEGSMDPLESRIALVGHIRATAPIVRGSLRKEDARRAILQAMSPLHDRIKSYRDVQGTITFELAISSAGRVESITTLTDNLVTASVGYGQSDAVATVRETIEQAVKVLRFAPADGCSTIVVPILVPLPDLRPIEFSVAHSASKGAVQEWAQAELGIRDGLEFRGTWKESTFFVEEPVAGRICVGPECIEFFFDPPMWVPSHRERLQVDLTDWARGPMSDAVA